MEKRRVCGSFVKSDADGMILFTVAAESLKACAASTRTLAGVPVARAVHPAVSAIASGSQHRSNQRHILERTFDLC